MTEREKKAKINAFEKEIEEFKEHKRSHATGEQKRTKITGIQMYENEIKELKVPREKEAVIPELDTIIPVESNKSTGKKVQKNTKKINGNTRE